jgi:hypothetical protein
MNPPPTPRRHPDARREAPPAETAGESPLTGEDIISDLDPGWLHWRREQADR